MQIKKAYRYELKPNVEQRITLAKHAGAARFAYNWGLKQRIDLYEKNKTFTNAIEQHRLLNSLKEHELSWMYEVSKCASQEALRDLDRAFKNFYRNFKQNKPNGFPKFKKKGIQDHFRLTGTIKIDEKKIQLPRLGVLRLKELSKVKGRILSATVSRQADRWFVSLPVEEEVEPAKPREAPIGIDVGLSSFITTSDGLKIAAPKPLKKALKKLKQLSKEHSRKQKGSQNRKKSACRLAKHHYKISNQRRDFQHKLSTSLTKTKSVMVIEDLDVKRMLREKRFNRHISDVGWAGFMRMLEYKAGWYGSTIIKAPRYYPSTKKCSNCHQISQTRSVEIRRWHCEKCGVEHDRDVNAAKNLLNLYTGSSPGIYACGDTSSGESEKLSSYVSLKQEVNNGIFVHKS